jgi:hypothetical protein
MNLPIDTYSAIADTSVAFAPPPAGALDDAGLIEAQRTLAEIRRRVDAASAVVAAEIKHRSRRELGYDGLAQRLGARTPELLVQRVAGTTSQAARSLVRIGTMMVDAPADAPPAPDATPWLREVGAAVASGRLSIDAAEAIRAGLGSPAADIDHRALAEAAATLLAEAPSLTVERLAARARDLRNELDLDGVADREQALRDRRYLHVIPQSDGMTRLSGLLDPESAAIIVSAYDSATSPRRGGPRFVDPERIARAEKLMEDQRTTEQIALDAFVDLVRIGGAADGGPLLDSRRPAVQLLVTDHDLQKRRGVAHIEGQTSAVSVETVDRHICEAGVVPVQFDGDGQVVNLGREQRLFSRRQRIGLAARDGGCRFGTCDRPPSWTEAHHINEWARDAGATDIADGILLCRHHHMLVHNNGWRVTRDGAEYYLVPPASLDEAQQPIPAPSKSRAARRMRATERREAHAAG